MGLSLIGYLLLFFLPYVLGANAPPEGRCLYTTVYKMNGADCANINLVSIPPATRKIEVLDVSVNRIRVLRNHSFTSYSYLRFLYLNDNPITIIEPGTFEPLEDLEVLDLSLNAIRDFPPILPANLRKLYLADNPLVTIPLSSAVSLQYLNLAGCFLKELPPLGELPQLKELNISANALVNLTVTQIASFCNLERLYISNELLDPKYLSSCDCVRVKRWTVQHSIEVLPYFNCTIPDNNMDCVSNSSDEARAFTACQVALQQQSASHWAAMAGGLLFIVICLIILAFIWRRRRVPKPQPHRTPEQEAAFRKRKLLEETPKSKF